MWSLDHAYGLGTKKAASSVVGAASGFDSSCRYNDFDAAKIGIISGTAKYFSDNFTFFNKKSRDFSPKKQKTAKKIAKNDGKRLKSNFFYAVLAISGKNIW